jgi:hypothetical protein
MRVCVCVWNVCVEMHCMLACWPLGMSQQQEEEAAVRTYPTQTCSETHDQTMM